MLEGLEASVIHLSELENGFRIDAELYSKDYVVIKRSLEAIPTTTLADECVSIRKGIFNVNASCYTNKGIPFVRISNLKNMIIDTSEIVYIPKFVHEANAKTSLVRNDVILSKTAIPAASLVTVDECNTSQDTVAVKLKKDSVINSHYLVVFLNTKYGLLQMQKRFTGNVQMHLNLDETKDSLIIPVLSCALQDKIKTAFEASIDKKQESEQLYSSAESYLLECLGMTDFAASTEAHNVKTLKESFLQTGRLDAEYYMPKYEDLERSINNYGSLSLKELVHFCRGNFIPDTLYTDTGTPYLRGADISSNRIEDAGVTYIRNIESENLTICRKGDIVFAMIGSVGTAAVVTSEWVGSYISNNLGLLRLKDNCILPEVLHLYMTSLVGKMFFEQRNMVTAQPKISFKDMEDIPIPLIRQEVQQEIAQHVQRSFALRKEALTLLENAKLTVERVIQFGGGKSHYIRDLQAQATQEHRLAVWLLLKEIGLFERKTNTVCTSKRLSESFLRSGRLDAEYYQPKYDRLFSRLNRFPTATIGELTYILKSIEPGSEAYQANGIPFVRVADLSKFGLSEPSIHLDATRYGDALRPRKDTILLSKDGSVGIAYKAEQDLNVITSGAILHLTVTSDKVLPDYLTLVLNSIAVKMQAERDAGGSIIQHWKPSEIEQVVIPILPMPIQKELSEKVQRSFALRTESQALLQEAKEMVERAIENR